VCVCVCVCVCVVCVCVRVHGWNETAVLPETDDVLFYCFPTHQRLS